MSQLGNIGDAARQAAIEAARRAAAEAAKKAAAEAAKKQAAEAAKQQVKQQAKQAVKPPKDEAKVEDGASKIEQAAKAEDKKSPWSLTDGIGKIAELGGDLGDVAKKGLKAITQAEDKKTAAIVDHVSGVVGEAGKAALEKLEKTGELTDRDSQGGNLRDRLDDYLKDGGDPRQAEAILEQIAHPDRNIRQLRDDTCVAANNMRDLAQQNPGEYFRMATELADSGKTTFPDGSELELSDETKAFLDKQADNPGDLASFAMQGAMMEYANGIQKYDLSRDTSDLKFDLGFIDIDTKDQRGLSIEQAQNLQDALRTAPMLDPRKFADADDQTRLDSVNQALEESKADGHQGLQIPMHNDDPSGKDRYHLKEVRAIEADRVVLWDVVTQRPEVMDRQEFLDNVGWDITADDDIGSVRGLQSGGGYVSMDVTPTVGTRAPRVPG